MGNSRSMSFDSSFRANSQGVFVPGSLASSPAVILLKFYCYFLSLIAFVYIILIIKGNEAKEKISLL